MKVTSLVAATLAFTTFPLLAATYTDTTGDIGVGSGFENLDITGVEVSNDATRLSFKISLAGDPVATDWGKYMIGIDSIAGGDTTGNGWFRPISMSSGMDYFVGGWADWGNGAELYNWNGAGWDKRDATATPNPDNIAFSKDSSSVTISFDFAGLGLGEGSTFKFDVWSSGGGGGDSAVDASSNPATSITGWGGPYDAGNLVSSYTLTAVPEPGVASLAVLGICLALARRSSKRA